MKNLFYLSILVLFLYSCKGGNKIPDAAKSVDEVKTTILGKSYIVTRTGTVNVNFNKERTGGYIWSDEMKEMPDMFKSTFDEAKKLEITFTSDTAAKVTAKDESADQTYVITDQKVEDEPDGIKLKLTFVGKDFFDATKTMTMTKTYYVLGLNEKSILLQLPQSINDQPLVVLMEVKE